MKRLSAIVGLSLVLIVVILSPGRANAQATFLKVVSADSVPIRYAWVSVRGADANVTDETGRVSLGQGRRKTLSVEVRRIGYAPWSGNLTVGDTAATITLALRRLTQTLGQVQITADHAPVSPAMKAFYERWLIRQKGGLSASFIGPEEIEKRHPNRTTDMLAGLQGIALMHGQNGAVCARGNGGSCFMTVLVDGSVLRNTSKSCSMQGALHIGPVPPPSMGGAEDNPADVGPDIDDFLDVNDVAAIEVYARGGNMPVSLQAPDNACGVVAIWTGVRR